MTDVMILGERTPVRSAYLNPIKSERFFQTSLFETLHPFPFLWSFSFQYLGALPVCFKLPVAILYG